MNRLTLAGTPEPLSEYLRSLGVLRLISEQKDPRARGAWNASGFVLETTLTPGDLEAFFLLEYRPTSLVAPWNGGSGFAPKDNQAGIARIEQSVAPRFASYREAIATGRRLRLRLGITEKAEHKKEDLIKACRAWLPDDAVGWMDAAIVLTSSGPAFPPILGTGGNDGRLDFSNNFMQRVTEILDPSGGEPPNPSLAWLRNALWGDVQPGLQRAAVGQFDPSGAGGVNGSSGFAGEAQVNPWDFVLMLEGALLFAAASTRRLGSDRPNVLSCPFTVYTVGAGFGSATTADAGASRAELWVPIWKRPASLVELKILFSEGRAQVQDRPARNGVDFARAVCTLGVDRGLSAFSRFAFLERNGQAYLAVPLGRFPVTRRPEVDLLESLGGWLETIHGRSSGDRTPRAVQRAVHDLQDAILALCRQGGPRLLDVLIATGRCEKALARSLKWVREVFVPPCPPLPLSWLTAVDDGSIEFRLASSLASLRHPPLRAQLEPVVMARNGEVWFAEQDADGLVWSDGPVEHCLCSILQRRLLRAAKEGEPLRLICRRSASLGEVVAFLEHALDDKRLADLIWALSLLDWSGEVPLHAAPAPEVRLPAALYSLLKLCFAGSPVFDVEVPVNAEIHRRASAGGASLASAAAIRRLRGCGLVPAVRKRLFVCPRESERTAAALVFPLSTGSIGWLCEILHIRVPQAAQLPRKPDAQSSAKETE